jgi:hypothetical protein
VKNSKSRVSIKAVIPYILIFGFNFFIAFCYPNSSVVIIPNVIILLCMLNFYLLNKLKNLFNKIISTSWFIFFFLGIININSIKVKTNIWNLKIYDASLLFVSCLLIFTISLLFFEKKIVKKVKFYNDLQILTNSFFPYLILLYPVFLILNIYGNLGFFPLLSGASFVDEMYEYNYGFLYSYKFICVYSFLLGFLFIKKGKSILLLSLYLVFLIFVVSVDGKRLILLMGLLSLLPPSIILKKESDSKNSQGDNLPIIIGFACVGFIYVLVNILRTGGDIQKSLDLIVSNIPFGVEYKDYVHIFNTNVSQTIKGYNFELSSMGSFFNSSLLLIFDLNKIELYQMGSQTAIMNLYNETFGIRIGIIGELYFAYGFLVIPLMVVIAFFTNRICQGITNAKSYFNLFQNSILFALFVLLINGQATVFFGTLTLMIYAYFVYIFSSFLYKKKKKLF